MDTKSKLFELNPTSTFYENISSLGMFKQDGVWMNFLLNQVATSERSADRSTNLAMDFMSKVNFLECEEHQPLSTDYSASSPVKQAERFVDLKPK